MTFNLTSRAANRVFLWGNHDDVLRVLTNTLPLEGSGLDAITVVEPKAADLDSQDKDAVIPTREAGTAVEPPDYVVGPKGTETVTPSKEEGVVVEPRHGDNQPTPLGLILGFRTGLSIPTQKVIQDFGNSTSIGPIINVEALYALREWVRVGLMLEWHRHLPMSNSRAHVYGSYQLGRLPKPLPRYLARCY